MDTKLLRQKILDLAIRGKLVPQDPNDEPASVLLERIKAEKEQLIKEGKIKRSKKTATTSDSRHYPFELPSGWVWATLGEIFTLQAGKNITAKQISIIQNTENKYPCFGGNGIRGYVARFNRSGNHPIIGRQGALCGNINLASNEFYATEHAVVVDFYCETNLMWCYYTLEALNLNQYATATAQPGLAVKVINDAVIALPPYKEQRRISDAISHWFSLINNIRSSKIQLHISLRQIRSKILDLAIHGKLVPQDPADEPASELLKRVNPSAEITCDNEQYWNMPNGWCVCRIKDLFKICMGQSPAGTSLNQIEGMEFHQGKICFTDKFLDKSKILTNRPTKIADANSLLICVRAPVGVLNINTRQICIGRGLCALLPSKCVDLGFAFHCLTTYQQRFEQKSTGSTFKAISGDIIKNELFPLPPLAEQQRIVAKIEELFAQLDAIENSLQA